MTEAMKSTTMEETAAVVAACNGDRPAFGLLVRLHQRRAYAAAYSLVRNRDDALELAQEAFVRAFRAIHTFDKTMPFYPWLYRILRNLCFNHLKKRRRHGLVSLDHLMENGYDATETTPDPSTEAELGDLRQSITEALARLSAEHREILCLRHFQEMSYNEIAECLNIPRGTVMSRLHAARRQMRGAILATEKDAAAV